MSEGREKHDAKRSSSIRKLEKPRDKQFQKRNVDRVPRGDGKYNSRESEKYTPKRRRIDDSKENLTRERGERRGSSHRESYSKSNRRDEKISNSSIRINSERTRTGRSKSEKDGAERKSGAKRERDPRGRTAVSRDYSRKKSKSNFAENSRKEHLSTKKRESSRRRDETNPKEKNIEHDIKKRSKKIEAIRYTEIHESKRTKEELSSKVKPREAQHKRDRKREDKKRESKRKLEEEKPSEEIKKVKRKSDEKDGGKVSGWNEYKADTKPKINAKEKRKGTDKPLCHVSENKPLMLERFDFDYSKANRHKHFSSCSKEEFILIQQRRSLLKQEVDMAVKSINTYLSQF
eukprot:snap_masked-scaffold_1-processed-gene-6.34-mRNA-1 protein AED:0.15 eAED:1.00 QI:0/-1/0/1/-1/1/1/0/346